MTTARIDEVPANADFVIEGYVDPTEPLRDEGPFGDHTGYYTLPEPYPVFHVTAITHRKDAVCPQDLPGASLQSPCGRPPMHGLWGMGQMMFTKYIIVVDDDVDVHNTS